MSNWSEIRDNFIDEEENVLCIDAWKTDRDDEEGTVIAKIHLDTKEVTYLDETARKDSYAQEVINEALDFLFAKEYEEKKVNKITLARNSESSPETLRLLMDETKGMGNLDTKIQGAMKECEKVNKGEKGTGKDLELNDR